MKFKTVLHTLLIALFLLFAIQGCDNSPRQGRVNEQESEVSSAAQNRASMFEDVEQAICVMYPAEGSNVSGTVTFTRNGSSILVKAELEGLTPGKHGFHIHEKGDCSAADASSAGGHFNPGDSDHGGPDHQERHVGDLGNIEAGEDGRATLELEDTVISFSGPNSIIGRSVVVHADEDDLTSQPTGDAGGRLACGVIGVVE